MNPIAILTESIQDGIEIPKTGVLSNGGRYTDLTGIVVYVEQTFPGDCCKVTVDVTGEGLLDGWIDSDHAPQVGYTATIRCYDIGGGWYPNDKIVGWDGSLKSFSVSDVNG